MKVGIESKSKASDVVSTVYSRAEEIANSSIHGLGVLLGITGLVLMLVMSQGEGVKIASSIIYGVSIILLFLASTLYHSVTKQSHRKIMKTLDHSAIYLLIAGTYTPYMLISLGHDGGWFYFTLIWSIALTGVLFKVFLGHKYPKVSLLSYLAMGWFVVVMGGSMMANVSTDGLVLLLAGGLCYTVGAIFYVWKKLAYNHAIWHGFVLGGAVCHFLSIYWYVLPTPTVS
jgi:hemolysin III